LGFAVDFGAFAVRSGVGIVDLFRLRCLSSQPLGSHSCQ
jgi:hypothetical protein